MKRQIEQAIRSAGSVKAAAAEIGISPGTLRRWRRQGVPKRGDGRAKLTAYKERRKDQRARVSSELAALKRLRKMAVKGDFTVPEGKKRPVFSRARTHDRKMDGRRAAGHMWVKAFNRELNLGTLNDIESWARTHRKRYPWWNILFGLVQFSRDEKHARAASGSDRTVEVMVNDPEKNLFMAEHWVGSPKNKSLPALLTYARKQLEEMIETGSTIFLLSVDLYNYRLRPETERKARETAYRRRAAWKESKKKSKSKKKTSRKKTSRKKTSPKKTSPKKARK